MTRFVRYSIASTSLAILALIASGCGGGDDAVTVVDAAVDATIDATPDAPPLVCNAPTMNCGGECVNVNTDEQHCGNCTTVCTGGQECRPGGCMCVQGFVPASPTFVQEFLDDTQLPGATVGLGGYFGSTINALVVGRATADVQENVPHTLTATLGTPPFLAAGYDVDTGTFAVTAAFYATAGTLTFTKICPNEGGGNMGGFSGTATDVTFSAVEGLMNPVLVPDGCTFDVASVSFTYGDVGCSAQ